ncbi:hypothetical protein QJQ45_016661 [Haematococcus lacustris]|nr:hypothetical protein QJQ45_016661 [Haematococcus lacustris]
MGKEYLKLGYKRLRDHPPKLTVTLDCSLEGLTQLLQALPQLHTLQLPALVIESLQALGSLQGATQLTSVQVGSVHC